MDFVKTNMALIVLVDKIFKALDEGKIVLAVFSDLSKALILLTIPLLLKIFKYGIRSSALN